MTIDFFSIEDNTEKFKWVKIGVLNVQGVNM